MEMTMTRTAIRKDRALSAVHGGALLASRTSAFAPKPSVNGALPQGCFADVTTYVADQGSHPPRGNSPV